MYLAVPIKGQNQSPELFRSIFQGDNTTIEEHPHQVSLNFRGFFICGGSIISRFFVLTAARCLENFNALTVRAGSTYIGKGGKLYKVRLIIIHEDYRFNWQGIPVYNIGLIRVTESFKYGPRTRPIRLFQSGEILPANARAVITGWNYTKNLTLLSVLQKLTMSIVDRNTCIKAYGPWRIPKGMICLGLEKGVCKGDSSDPLTIKGRLAGISSWPFGCGNLKCPGAFTEVAYHYKWIEDKIKLWC